MTTQKQKKASQKNIVQAQKKWKSMTHRQHALAQPQGRSRKMVGMGGTGNFYRIEVRPKSQFTSFRVQDVGKKGGIERLAGRRSSGSWNTHTWLIAKNLAHKQGTFLVSDNKDVEKVFAQLGSQPKHVKGDIFKAKPRKNVPEKDKPTTAQKRAWAANIKKAQAIRAKKK